MHHEKKLTPFSLEDGVLFQGAKGNFYSRTIGQLIDDIREFQLSNFSDDNILETIRKGNEREIRER